MIHTLVEQALDETKKRGKEEEAHKIGKYVQALDVATFNVK